MLDAARLLRISTDRPGPRRWWQVTIYPNVRQLRAALADRGIKPANVWGYDRPAYWAYTQPASYWRDGDGHRYPADGFAGDVLLAEPYVTAEIVGHELVHAAVATLRMGHPQRQADLGDEFGQPEEVLATIYGQLYADLRRQLPGIIGGRLETSEGTINA